MRIRQSGGLLLLWVMMSCTQSTGVADGKNHTASTRGATAAAAAPTPWSGRLPSPPASNLSVDREVTAADAHLNVVGSRGITNAMPSGMHCPWLVRQVDETVLATDRTSYSVEELPEIGDYIDSEFRQAPRPVPPELRKVPGVLVGSGTCSLAMEITNAGHSTIAIPEVRLRLTRAPDVNNSRYDLIDLCTVSRRNPCPLQLGGGPGPCDFFYAQVVLQQAASDALFAGRPSAATGECPQLTLAPGETKEVEIDAHSIANLVYSVEPQLVVVDGTAVEGVPLPNLGGSMAFANPSQFSCYRLQSGALTQITEPITIGFSGVAGAVGQQHSTALNFCV
jgi:hypothetical protein